MKERSIADYFRQHGN